MEHKIIFTGPVGAGKTTAIGTISDIPVVSTESRASDGVARLKATTTVAMDYGVMKLGEGLKVHLYGTPGQERFSFMWDIITIGGLGMVILVDNDGEDPLADLEFYVRAFDTFIKRNALVVGVTRMDKSPRPGLYSYHTRLKELGVQAPVFEVDARNRGDVSIMLQALLAMLDPGAQR
ncbi:ATP/GTP-binding protein [Marinobacter sp.]|uniref:GTP-binding protein n=1 Tax=Marinobacter sp. TaxID=50741 RepID=UPI0019B6313C|nr:ATP/GTP-binding protein [Marinobacter sp.]MBD3657559.1 ATP/GTP-binding protein [Marinobacter sp.]